MELPGGTCTVYLQSSPRKVCEMTSQSSLPCTWAFPNVYSLSGTPCSYQNCNDSHHELHAWHHGIFMLHHPQQVLVWHSQTLAHTGRVWLRQTKQV